MKESLFVKMTKIYEKYGYNVITGLNPYHFKNNGFLKFPFTYISPKIDPLREFSIGGGLLLLKFIFLKVYLLFITLKIYLSLAMLLVGVQ